MDRFLEIEKILHFHHTTSRQPLRVSVVRLRCFQNGTAVSQEDIERICRIWPQAYKLYTSRGNFVMEAPDLPHNAHSRRETFAKLWKEKENLAMTAETNTIKPEPPATYSSANREPLRRIAQQQMQQQQVLMGRLKKEPVNQSLSLLDRIRAKESRIKQERTPPALQRVRDAFLRSQIPKVKRIFDELAGSSDHCSLEIERIMEILRTNLFKLGDDELNRALHLFMQMYPTFCSIVTVGSSTHVKLQKPPSVVC